MARLILALAVVALALAVLRMAVIVLVFAGLIFRTKTTLAWLLLGGLLTLLDNHPAIGLSLLAFIMVAGIVQANRKQESTPEPPKLLN